MDESWAAAIDADIKHVAQCELARQYRAASLLLAGYEELVAISRRAYAARRNSDGYWHYMRARLMEQNIGHIEAILHEATGTPPPGVIWIQPSYRLGRPRDKAGYRKRKVKKGRPLTMDEMFALLAAKGLSI